MARGALYEESAIAADERSERRKYQIFHVASIVCVVLIAIMIFLTFALLPSVIGANKGVALAIALIIWFLPLLSFVGFFFLFWKLKRRFNLSFDYTFVQDELRITKVFNGKSRKHLVTLKADQMLKIGYVEGESYRRLSAGLRGKKPVILTPNHEPMEGKVFAYIHYSTSIEKTLYILECRKELLEYVVFAAGRNKFDPS